MKSKLLAFILLLCLTEMSLGQTPNDDLIKACGAGDLEKVKTLVGNINRVLEGLTDTQRELLSHCNNEEYNGDRLIMDGVEYGSDEDDAVQAKVYDDLSVNLVR